MDEFFDESSFTDEELGLDPNDPDIVEKRKEALRKLRLARKNARLNKNQNKNDLPPVSNYFELPKNVQVSKDSLRKQNDDEINDVMNQLLQPTSAPPKKPPKPSRPPTKRAQPTQNQQKSTQRQQNTQNTAHSRPISNREAVAPLLNPRVDRTQYGLTSTVANNTSPQSTQKTTQNANNLSPSMARKTFDKLPSPVFDTIPRKNSNGAQTPREPLPQELQTQAQDMYPSHAILINRTQRDSQRGQNQFNTTSSPQPMHRNTIQITPAQQQQLLQPMANTMQTINITHSMQNFGTQSMAGFKVKAGGGGTLSSRGVSSSIAPPPALGGTINAHATPTPNLAGNVSTRVAPSPNLGGNISTRVQPTSNPTLESMASTTKYGSIQSPAAIQNSQKKAF